MPAAFVDRIFFDVIWFIIVLQIKMRSPRGHQKQKETNQMPEKTILMKKNDQSQAWQHKKQTILNK